MTDTANRSRLNLVLISFFLTIYYAAEIVITKFSFLGIEAVAGKPDVLFMALWLMWAYFLLRYLNQFIQGGKEEIVKRSVSTSLGYYLALEDLERKKRELNDREPEDGWAKGSCEVLHHEIKEYTRLYISLEYRGKCNNTEAQGGHTYEESITRIKGEWGHLLNLKSLFRSTTRTTEILEYIFPFALSAAPVLAAVAAKLLIWF